MTYSKYSSEYCLREHITRLHGDTSRARISYARMESPTAGLYLEVR